MLAIVCSALAGRGEVVLETQSRYHQIRVVDERGVRILSFNGSMETRMSLTDPLQGHFQYVDFFHMPWLWNARITNVLMIGLGGGSTQRSYLHHYPWVEIDTVEIDPLVVKIAKEWFHLQSTNRHRIHVEDGRVHLRRSEAKFDLIILDAYVQNRYGGQVPHHLTTREFFELAQEHLRPNGLVAFNVIGDVRGYRADRVAAIYKTMRTVFSQVYLFQAAESDNIVMVATLSKLWIDGPWLQRQSALLKRIGRPLPVEFDRSIYYFRRVPPVGARRAAVLTDDRPLRE